MSVSDMLSAEQIKFNIGEIKPGLNIIIKESVTSTNAVLKQMAANGEKQGTVLIASHQTEGRGRFKREFFSPDESGVYMSILLRPEIAAEKAVLITTAAAVAVAKSIEDSGGESVGIKWVNDIILNNKKVCGILTESGLNANSGKLDYAVLGIGLNVYIPENGFPKNIENIAGAVFKEKQDGLKNRLVALIIKHFFEFYENLENKNYINYYRKHCTVINKNINVISGERVKPAYVLDVDEDCRLLVRYEDGSTEYLNSGEISIVRRESNPI